MEQVGVVQQMAKKLEGRVFLDGCLGRKKALEKLSSHVKARIHRELGGIMPSIDDKNYAFH